MGAWVERFVAHGIENGLFVVDRVVACTLPFTKVSFANNTASNNNNDEYIDSVPAYQRIRSPFVAINRNSNHPFESLFELETTIRSDVRFQREMVPAWSATVARHGLNAYAYDFYKHGQLSAITRFNQLRDAWLQLDQFSNILSVSSLVCVFFFVDYCFTKVQKNKTKRRLLLPLIKRFKAQKSLSLFANRLKCWRIDSRFE